MEKGKGSDMVRGSRLVVKGRSVEREIGRERGREREMVSRELGVVVSVR